MSSKLKLKSTAGGSLSLIVDDTITTDEEMNISKGGIVTVTNANGTAIKYPDGTLICRGTGVNNSSVTFPISFTATPTISIAGINNPALSDTTLTTYSCFNPSASGIATLYARYIAGTGNPAPSGDTIMWIAIGRWK